MLRIQITDDKPSSTPAVVLLLAPTEISSFQSAAPMIHNLWLTREENSENCSRCPKTSLDSKYNKTSNVGEHGKLEIGCQQSETTSTKTWDGRK